MNKNTPKFSIITVCRNEVSGIRMTCESIIKQTYLNYEWIVIDGASTDGTLEIIEAYRHSINILISKPDKGIYDAMNKGIDKARGEYLIFINGGDAFATVNALALATQAPQKEIIYGDLRLDTFDGEVLEYSDNFQVCDLIKSMLPHQATFYSRELFEAYGRYDTSYRIAADYELNARLISKYCVSRAHISEPIAVFNRDGVSNKASHKLIRKKENHQIRMKYFTRYRWSVKAWKLIIRNLFRKDF